MLKPFQLLTPFERRLWGVSLVIVTLSSLLGGVAPLNILASLLGVTALIFVAKGHVLGQVLTIAFSLLYGLISYQFHYYGEMITYLGMTAPMALLATVSWLRHPAQPGQQEVKVAPFYPKDWVLLSVLTLLVTALFYGILEYFHTANLMLSTLSIATSFSASYLTFRRSPYYALAYALNDLVLIGMWLLATLEHSTYLTMVVCFSMFLLNDLYGYHQWKQMQCRQSI